MELYEKSTEKLLNPILWLKEEYLAQFNQEIRQRSKEISYILEGLESYPLEETVTVYEDLIFRANYRNIKSNRDIPRQEFRGACTKYLLGFFQDSMLQSFSTVESALLTIHDERIQNNIIDETKIRYQFTLGPNIDLAISKIDGFITDVQMRARIFTPIQVF